jgi:hypothetical protein
MLWLSASLLVFLFVSNLHAQASVIFLREIPGQNPQDVNEKRTRTPAQQRIDSQLLKAARLNQIRSYRQTDDQRGRKYDCLPTDVRLSDVVTYDRAGKANVTLEKTLISLGAKCRNRKLMDRKHREIRFFRPACWGRPPPNYLEIEQKEDEELRKLKRRYTVVVFGCNPTLAANPPRSQTSSSANWSGQATNDPT